MRRQLWPLKINNHVQSFFCFLEPKIGPHFGHWPRSMTNHCFVWQQNKYKVRQKECGCDDVEPPELYTMLNLTPVIEL